MTCKYCGAPLPQDTLICPVCGKAQDSVSQEVEDQVQAALGQAQAALNGSAARDSHDDSKPEESASQEKTAGDAASSPEQASAVEKEKSADSSQSEDAFSAIRKMLYESEDQDNEDDDYYSGPIYARPPVQSFDDFMKEHDPSVPTTGQYFFMELVMRLPIIGFIVSLVWGLSSRSPEHRRNLARANILLSLLGLVVRLALLAILVGILSTIMAAFMSYGSYYDNYPEYFGDFFGHGDGYYDYYDDYYDDYYGYYGEYPYYFNSAPSA